MYCYWNIHSVINKLANSLVLNTLLSYGVTWLSKLRSNLGNHLPEYKLFRNPDCYSSHGGICLFIKHYLLDDVKEVTFSKDDIIFVNFR